MLKGLLCTGAPHAMCRVISHESQNKMGLSNVVRIFGPTLMTVDGDTVSQPHIVTVYPHTVTLSPSTLILSHCHRQPSYCHIVTVNPHTVTCTLLLTHSLSTLHCHSHGEPLTLPCFSLSPISLKQPSVKEVCILFPYRYLSQTLCTSSKLSAS